MTKLANKTALEYAILEGDNPVYEVNMSFSKRVGLLELEV